MTSPTRLSHWLSLSLCLGALAACGQKGNLYEPDTGITVAPRSSPAAAAPAPAPATGQTGDAAPVSPTAPASPDRSDEARKRVPRTPTPAEAK
jgi:predicted small lipoprotein YifL